MGLFDLLRDAIQPTTAAVAGYQQGKSAEEDKLRAEGIQDAALQRQSLLDQIKAQVDQSTIDRNTAQADRYGRLGAPRDSYDQIVGDDGTVYLRNRNDPTDVRVATMNGSPIKTHVPLTPADPIVVHQKNRLFDVTHPLPQSGASANTQDRIDTKTALDEARAALPHPSKVPKTITPTLAQITAAQALPANKGKSFTDVLTSLTRPNPAYSQAVSDSTNMDNNIVQPIRQHLFDVTLGSKVAVPTPSATSSPGASAVSTASPDASSNAADALYARAADAFKQTLAKPGADPDAARARYDALIATIAKKFGQLPPQ